MSFQFSAAGSPEEVIGQLMEADAVKDSLGEAVRQLLIEHFRFPKGLPVKTQYVFTVTAAGSSDEHAVPALHIETDVIWVPYVHADTAEEARQLAQRGPRVPEGD